LGFVVNAFLSAVIQFPFLPIFLTCLSGTLLQQVNEQHSVNMLCDWKDHVNLIQFIWSFRYMS
jgi:hypothetical protein